MHKQDLFTAQTNGYHNYRIPGIVTAGDGSILAYCEARMGSGGDWDLIDIQMRRSNDGGRTWQPSETLVHHTDFEDGGVHNFVMIVDHITGGLHALFGVNYARVFSMYSTDHGRSFSNPLEITDVFADFRAEYNWKVCATGPGHGIQLQNGRLLVPVWLSTGEGAGGHRPSVITSMYSDDHGKSWQAGAIIAQHDPRIVNPSETVAVELSDGRVLFNIRSESREHRRLTAISPDGANQWSMPEFDNTLLEPVCMGSILGLRKTPNTIVFANPSNLEQTLPGAKDHTFDRKRLTYFVSKDDCQTWTNQKVIEEGPSGYCDLTEAPDGSILCFYERGYNTRMTDTKYLTIVRFTIK